MFVSFTMRLSIECGSCRTMVPVNGIVPSAHCSHCGSDTELSAKWWGEAFESAWFAAALGFDEDKARARQIAGRIAARLAFGRRTPRCQACMGPDLDPSALAGMLAVGHCFCPTCGHPIQLRAADGLCRAIQRHAQFLVGETAVNGHDAAIERKAKPVVFQCMNCSGPLHVDGTSRTVKCEHCGETNYLPDGLWLQLNPVPKEQVFFLVCDFDRGAARKLRWSQEELRVEDARSPGITAEDARTLALDASDEVRQALARNPRVPAEVLATLARDTDRDVRVWVAHNPSSPPDALEVLTAADSGALSALLQRELSPELVDRIAQNGEREERVLAASHAQVSLATLHRLAHDSDDEVRTAARARLKQLEAQGVDIHPGRGFLGKLFRG